MERLEGPRADRVLLLYLAFVTALVGLFALTFYGLMQPTVVPNAGLAGYQAPRPATTFLYQADTSSEAMERAAIAAARADNKDQGIEPLRAFASAEVPAGQAGPIETAKPAKPKQVARKRPPERLPPADPWQSWRSAERQNGWFGSPMNSRPSWGWRDNWR
jgi:hypothetical protein